MNHQEDEPLPIEIQQLDLQILERIYQPVVRLFYEKFKQAGLLDLEEEFFKLLSSEAKSALLLSLSTHVNKDKAVFSLLVSEHLGLETNKTKILAIALDILWSTSLIMDDLVDGDITRFGKPTIWTIYGKDKTYSLGMELFSAVIQLIEKNCGNEVSTIIRESVMKGVQSTLAQPSLHLINISLEQLFRSYDDRNDFNGAAGIDATFCMLNRTDEYSKKLRVDLMEGIRLLNRGSQILNDLRDLDNVDSRGLSDVKNGVATVPLFFLYGSFTEAERSYFLSFFGAKRELTEPEIKFVTDSSLKYCINRRVADLSEACYSRGLQLFGQGFSNNDRELLESWVNYKRGTLSKYG